MARTLALTICLFCCAALLASATVRYKDCHELRLAGKKESGAHVVYINDTQPVHVRCEHTVNGSYTVIQQRLYGNENFYRGWTDYVNGFGVPSGDYWAGLNLISHLTLAGNTVLLVQLQDWYGNNRQAVYRYFYVADASGDYRLSIGGFSGTVPDDMSYQNGMPFATYDRPDFYKCAINQKAGWWYNYCAYSLLNGVYYRGGPYAPSGTYYDGIYWKDWLGFGYSLRFVSMSVSRP